MSLMWRKYHISLHMRLRRQLGKFSFSSLNFQLEGLIYIEIVVTAASKGQTKGSNQNSSHLHWWTEESSFLSRYPVLWTSAVSSILPPHHKGRCSLRTMHPLLSLQPSFPHPYLVSRTSLPCGCFFLSWDQRQLKLKKKKVPKLARKDNPKCKQPPYNGEY